MAIEAAKIQSYFYCPRQRRYIGPLPSCLSIYRHRWAELAVLERVEQKEIRKKWKKITPQPVGLMETALVGHLKLRRATVISGEM